MLLVLICSLIMNRYFIAHVLTGKVGAFCQKLSAELALVFSVNDAHAHVPPHLTLKAPFTANQKQVQEMNAVLEQLTDDAAADRITLAGYDHFNKGVIYLEVKVPETIRSFSQRLTLQLKMLPWMSFSPHDEEITFHATLVRPQSPEQFLDIWRYLEDNYAEESFTADFTTVSVLEKDTNEKLWSTHTTFQLDEDG